jgi:GAF domain-containing protein/PAS domain-containing protein
MASLCYSDDRAECQEKLTQLPQQPPRISQWKTRLLCQDGRVIWVNARARLASVGESETVISLVCEEIADLEPPETPQTQLERSLEELRWQEALLRTMTSASPLAFYVVDNRTDTILYFNRRFCEIWGIEHLEEKMQRGALKNSDIIPHCLPLIADVPAFAETCQPLQSEANRAVVEDEIPFTNGRTIRRFSTQIRDESDRYFGRFYLFEDITKRRRSARVLRQQFLRERLLRAIAQRLYGSLDLEKILNTTVAEVRQLLECDRVLIFRLHDNGMGVVAVESVKANWCPITGTVIDDRYFAHTYMELYRRGRVQAVEDIYTAGLTPCHVELLARFQVRANLVVPIVQEEKLWGLLVAQQCSGTRRWEALEIDLLKSLATQTAIALQQSELYQQAQTEIRQRQHMEEELRQSLTRERMVGEISQRIRQSLDLEEILERAVAEVRQVLQTDRVIIFRFEPDWSGVVEVESVAAGWSAVLGRNIYDPCFEESYISPYAQGRIKAIADIYAANLNPCHVEFLAQFQVRANLVVPILQGDRLWGLLIAHHCRAPRQWQQFETDVLTSLADQLAIAIQQGELYEQAQVRAKREGALNHVTQAIRSSLDLNTIFATAVREIGELLQVDRVQIAQYIPERQLWLHVSEYLRSPDSPASLGLEVPDLGNPFAEQLKQFKIVRIDDTNTCEDEINRRLARQFPDAWLLVPLQVGSSVWGSLSLVKETCPYSWQNSEVELICAVANQLAIAIHQSQLYEQSRSATITAQTKAEQLELALGELQKTQAQLVQSEKMSSLGQLVAGVAHEINNPVNFIYANLGYANDYTQDILNLLRLYQQQFPNPTPEIWDEIVRIDLDFLLEDLPKILGSMKVGAERICEIVQSLRTFSRFAEADMKVVDLHEGLDSTLMILQSRLKANGKHPEIQAIKEYEDLPKVECYAGQLNQVFMNLLVNAIDAIDEQNQERSPEAIAANPSWIRLSTEFDNDSQVVIRIADNGPGMTEQVRQHLFDPFFTTKPVGTGTGLGLSISYQIVVEKHRGQLHCHSELGKGTEFAIEIPVQSVGRKEEVT